MAGGGGGGASGLAPIVLKFTMKFLILSKILNKLARLASPNNRKIEFLATPLCYSLYGIVDYLEISHYNFSRLEIRHWNSCT